MAGTIDYELRLKQTLAALQKMRAKVDSLQQARKEPIAVIGMGCRFPGGVTNPASYWQLLHNGVDAITDIPADRWDRDLYYDPDPTAPGKMYVRQGGFIDRVDQFDPHFFGISPREAIRMDPQQRLFLEVAWEALENAGVAPARMKGSQTGVFVGVTGTDYLQLQFQRTALAEIDAYSTTGNILNAVAGRVAYTLGLHGPSMAIDTACSSSLTAIHVACQNLRAGETNMAIAGGVNLVLLPEALVSFSRWGMLAADARCKTFDDHADGFIRAEGCGAIVLKRLSDALADGDNILALILGSAANQDGASSGFSVPNGLAQQAVIRQALANAGVEPDAVDYVEAHGTGTSLGDPIEVEALGLALCTQRAPEHPLTIGSVKTNIGHAEAAAGVAGLMKVVLGLQHEEIPPHLHLQTRSRQIDWAQWPIEIPTQPKAWPRSAKPRIAGVSAFGFSGNNVHIVLGEAPVRPVGKRPWQRSHHLLTLSAKSEEALHAVASEYCTFLADHPALSLADLCFTANTGRSHFSNRLAVTAESIGEMRDRLMAFADGAGMSGIATGEVLNQARPKVAFLFTGQGAQVAGMGRELYAHNAIFRQTLDQCDAILRPHLEHSLLTVLFAERPELAALLDETAYTQPALFAFEYALAQVWQSWGIRPAAVMGHSVGEYVAACVAGVMSLEDGLMLIAQRGRLMQALPKEGSMVAVFAPADVVMDVIGPLADQVSIAAYNAPSSIVISGRKEAVDAVVERLASRKHKTRALVVSHAFHSPLMEPILAEFEAILSQVTLTTPRLQLISNLTGRVADHEIATPGYWVRHLRQPVRFAQGVDSLIQEEIDCFVEIGPKPVLLGLARQSLTEAVGSWLPSLRAEKPEMQQMLESLGELYVHGSPVDWQAVDGDYAERKVTLPTYPFQRQRYWLEPSKPASVHAAQAQPVAHSLTDPLTGAGNKEPWRDWLFDVQWQRQPKFGLPPRYLPQADEARRHLAGSLAELQREVDLGSYEQAQKQLESISVDYVVAALSRMGLAFELGKIWQDEAVAAALNVVPQQRRLLGRLLAMLGEAGILRREGAAWAVAQLPSLLQDSTDRLHSLRARIERLAAAYQDVAQAQCVLLRRCAEKLPEVLWGEQEPLELLFPGGDMSTMVKLYADAPVYRIMNTLVQQALLAAVAKYPARQGIRILEVGAGTGGTTSHLLPHLPSDQTEYFFTDIGASFLAQAQKRFQAYDFVRYQTLDIEQEPATQGFEPHQFDIVVAANVLHATRNLRETLRHVRRLLAPGGILVLLEVTGRSHWIDLTFGLSDGWWRFEDVDVRPDHPLLTVGQWRDLLHATGFQDEMVAMPESPTPGFFPEQNVMVAWANERTTSEALVESGDPWLIFADQEGTGVALAEALRMAREDAIVVFAGSGYQQLTPNSFQLDPAVPADTVRLLDTLPRVRGVVHLWSLDQKLDDATTVDALMEAEARGCGSILNLVQGLLQQGSTELPRLWLVSRQAQAVRAADCMNPAQTTLWGLAQTISLEHPLLRCTYLDLPEARDISAGQWLLDELLAPDHEDRLALREGNRYVARLLPAAVADSVATLPDMHADAAYLVTGGLGGLGLLVAEWLVAHGTRHLVLMGRSGATSAAARHTVQKLEAAGAEIVVAQGDVALANDIDRVLVGIAQRGLPLKGIIHSAGLLDDGVLVHQSWPRFETVLGPKVRGAWYLHQQTQMQPLDFFVLFSSASALIGSAGQGNHASANAFLDGLAHYRQAQGLPGLSINWGRWAGVGRAARQEEQRQQRWEERGAGSMTPEEGIAIFEALLGSSAAQVGVLPVRWSTYFASLDGDRPLLTEMRGRLPAQEQESSPAVQEQTFEQRLTEVHPSKQRSVILGYVTDFARSILQISPSRPVNIQQPLSEYGLDSLMALELRNALSRDIGHDLPATLLFDQPTIGALADYLERELLATNAAHSPGNAAGDPPHAGKLGLPTQGMHDQQSVTDIANLSDDEAASLLLAELDSSN